MPTTIPPKLRALILDSTLEGKTLLLAQECEQILEDNKLPFFPAYTNHGVAHVRGVMESMEKLIPTNVWDSGFLSPADGSVMIGSAYLHDLAMHIREPGFLALISDDGLFKPLPWFGDLHGGRHPDIPWPELWQGFRKDARRFSESDLERILGPGFTQAPAIAWENVDKEPENWVHSDYLLVGEFLRRHHARLAHEIAVYGFPGVPSHEFPVLRDLLPNIADIIGATARSHGEELRVASEYLQYRDPGGLRLDGALVHYSMGLLRVADYLQLQSGRATPLLLHLREPQSPMSVAEWEKHQAVSDISWDNKDPHAVRVRVTHAHNLRIHLQLKELLASLQSELDVTSAVLSETYGASDLAPLQMVLQRVRSNLDEPALHRELSFVPVKTQIRSAEDLFRLVVGDLYGNEPAVAGRELLQNAVDAIRELAAWAERNEVDLHDDQFRSLGGDVLVEVQRIDDDHGRLRIADRGIGMTPTTVAASFLTAGSSYRELFDAEDMNDVAAVRWMKAGRFGVGVLAAFLLGTEIHVSTRHAAADQGVEFVATMEDDLVEMEWVTDLPIGTEVIVPFKFEALPVPFQWEGDPEERYLHLLQQIASYCQIGSPSVRYLYRDGEAAADVLDHEAEVPMPFEPLPSSWRSVDVAGLESVLWSLPRVGWAFSGFLPTGPWGSRIAHNGFVIRKPDEESMEDAYEWASPNMKRLLRYPSLAIFDARERLAITLNRYELSDSTLPFEDELLRSLGWDMVAHALSAGPEAFPFGNEWGFRPIASVDKYLPLVPALCDRYLRSDILVFWYPEAWDGEFAVEFLDASVAGESWREFPNRIALPVDEIRLEDDFDPDDEEEDDPDTAPFERHAAKSSLSFASLLRREVVGGVAAVVGGEIADLFEKNEIDDAGLAGSLKSICKEIRKSDASVSFALAVLRQSAAVAPIRDEPIADAWVNLVGGTLERDSQRRRERKEQMVVEHDRLGSLITSWVEHKEATDSEGE